MDQMPPRLTEYRQKLFQIPHRESVTFTQAEFTRYWPFVQNVWCLGKESRLVRDGGTSTHGLCRRHHDFRRDRSTAGGAGIRKRKPHDVEGDCAARIKIRKVKGKVTIMGIKGPHSHDLDYMDARSTNEGLLYLVIAVNKNLDGATNSVVEFCRENLGDAGGRYMSVDRVRSAIRGIAASDEQQAQRLRQIQDFEEVQSGGTRPTEELEDSAVNDSGTTEALQDTQDPTQPDTASKPDVRPISFLHYHGPTREITNSVPRPSMHPDSEPENREPPTLNRTTSAWRQTGVGAPHTSEPQRTDITKTAAQPTSNHHDAPLAPNNAGSSPDGRSIAPTPSHPAPSNPYSYPYPYPYPYPQQAIYPAPPPHPIPALPPGVITRHCSTCCCSGPPEVRGYAPIPPNPYQIPGNGTTYHHAKQGIFYCPPPPPAAAPPPPPPPPQPPTRIVMYQVP